MAKDKTSQKKKRRKKQEVRKEKVQRKAAYNNTCKLIDQFYQKIAKKATQDSASLISRSILHGFPDTSVEDPLNISGLEHLLLTYQTIENKNNWTNGSQVSLISIGSFLDSCKAEDRGTLMIYKGLIVQSLDPESSYGKLQSKQNHRGNFCQDRSYDDGLIYEREVHLYLQVDKPNSMESRFFKDRKSLVPKLVFVNPARPVRIPDENIIDNPVQKLERYQIVESLSDFEIDRLWEFTTELAKWIIDPVLSLKLRLELKNKLTLYLDNVIEEEEKISMLVSEETSSMDNLRTEIEALLRSQKEAEREKILIKSGFDIDMARLKLKQDNLEKEISRLKSVRLSLLEKVRVEGGDLEYEKKIKNIQRKFKELSSLVCAIQDEMHEIQSDQQVRLNKIDNSLCCIISKLDAKQSLMRILAEKCEQNENNLLKLKTERNRTENKMIHF